MLDRVLHELCVGLDAEKLHHSIFVEFNRPWTDVATRRGRARVEGRDGARSQRRRPLPRRRDLGRRLGLAPRPLTRSRCTAGRSTARQS